MSGHGVGIICEYNPFHNGHAYQIETLKNNGADFIVCVMSGDFVQRGEACFQDKTVRAENAVKCGADIVLELPFPFSSLGAEGFAASGIEILTKSGLVSSFAFGSECADMVKLSRIAEFLDTGFSPRVSALQKERPNMSYAAAREELVRCNLGKEYADICRNPNDILAIEYLKANMKSVNPLTPLPVKRETPRGGFDENFASSSYIRHAIICKDNPDFALSSMPKNCSQEGIYGENELFCHTLFTSLLLKSASELRGIAEVPSGYEHLITKSAKKAKNYGELCSLLTSKTVTDAKIRRMLLFSFFGVTKQAAKQLPLYTNLLAFSEKGREMLKKYKKERSIIIASRAGDVKQNADAFAQYTLARTAEEVLIRCVRPLNLT